LAVMPSMAADNFKLINQWEHHNSELFGRVWDSQVDKDGHIICAFSMLTGGRLITSGKVIEFGPFGQGPGDIETLMCIIPFKSDIAIVERADKIKLFKKNKGTYVYKDIFWLKRGKFPFIISDGIFVDNKWFLAGFAFLNYDPNILKSCYIKVFDQKGKPLKEMINKEYKKKDYKKMLYLMNYYIVGNDNRLFFLPENELKVTVISAKELAVKKEVKLEIPHFYKKMPDDFYAWEDKNNEFKKKTKLTIEKWKAEYSRISKVLLEGDKLIVQIRTCNDKLKTYALLFYNANSFKLEKTFFFDDFLMGVNGGKYYFYSDGDPEDDDDTDQCIISIYDFATKKEK